MLTTPVLLSQPKQVKHSLKRVFTVISRYCSFIARNRVNGVSVHPLASHVAVQQDGEECIVIVILCSALSSRMIERIFSGAVTRGSRHASAHDKMSYTEFVWFLLSEEDKTHPTAIEYWFRCMDLDGDGYLSMYELEYFYEEQLQRMDAIGMETLPFEDCLCQVTFYTDLI